MFRVDNFLEQLMSCKFSYSLEGEDALLEFYLGNKPKGFYVDVGAYHPITFSNTYRFYKKGWSGINIDARPQSMNEFERVRPRDINLEMGISQKQSKLMFHIFEEPAISTFDVTLANQYKNLGYKVQDVVEVKTRPLTKVFEQHLPKGISIDFLSIDVEGRDLEVLKSNNWDIYRPTFVVVEVPEDDMKTIEAAVKSETTRFMEKVGYSLVSKTFNSLFFRTKQ